MAEPKVISDPASTWTGRGDPVLLPLSVGKRRIFRN